MGMRQLVRDLLGTTCSRLIADLKDAGLLHDLADEIRSRIGNDDLARGLEAAARFREQGERPEALELIDPDIRTAVSALLGLDGAEPEAREYTGPGYPRADHLVSADERKAIAARLAEPQETWPTPPCTPPTGPTLPAPMR